MTLRQAIKMEKVIEVELDLYLTEDGRTLKYDRYRKGSCKWVDMETAAVYRNFFEAYHDKQVY